MDTKEDEEHVGHHLEEMLKNELNVSIQILNVMIKEANVHFLFFELINFLVKLIANITTEKMGEVGNKCEAVFRNYLQLLPGRASIIYFYDNIVCKMFCLPN